MSEIEIPERVKKYIDFNGPNGCWIWTGAKTKAGYGNFLRTINGKNKQFYAHRYIYKLKHGEIEKGLYCCHHCDVPACCNPDHIFLGTGSDNSQDMVNKDRMYNICKKLGMTKEEITAMYKDEQHSYSSLANKLGVGIVSLSKLLKDVDRNPYSNPYAIRKAKITREQLIAMYKEENHTYTSLADKLNVDITTVCRALKGIPKNKKNKK